MLNIIKVILFVLVNIAGWFTLQVVGAVAMKIGVFPQLPGDHMEIFKYWYFYVGLWIWMAAAAVSVAYFFASDEKKNWFLLAPMYVMATYASLTILYFSFIYTIN